jgi:outer membrane lipoprotein SlyB
MFMRGNSLRATLLPVLLAAGVAACANGVQPGIVNSSYGSGQSYGSSQPYSSGPSYGSSQASASTYSSGVPGESGRVVAINDASVRGAGGSGNGPLVGGLLGGLGGMAIGASGGRGIGGGLVGGVIGAVGGAIAGTIFDRQSGGRGIEVTVQKDNGQSVTIAQRDDGDVQLGDRVQIVQDRNGAAKAVRDNSRQRDYQNYPSQTYTPSPQDYRQSGNYGGSGNYGNGNYGPSPQDYRQSGSGPQPADYGQPQGYARPQSSSHSGYSSTGYDPTGGYQTGPQPQNDPRYGTLQ